MMKFVCGATCAAFVVAFGFAAVSAGDQEFTLRNRTGYTIEQVFVSPSNDDSWGEDVLGRDIMDDNDNVEITFSRRESTCVWEDFDLCTIEEITLGYDGKRPTATWK